MMPKNHDAQPDVRPTVVVLSGRRRPHEVLLLGVGVFSGTALAFGAPPPNSIVALLPHWAVMVWAVGLAIHGVIGLVGIFWRSSRSLALEQAAMLIGIGALLWYIVAVAQVGPRGLFAGLIPLGWAVANLIRALEIRHELRGR